MIPDIGLLLLVLGITLLLFSFEWVSVDIVGLGVVLALILTGLLPVDMALAGYGSETVVMILGLLILTAMLVRTGLVERMGRLLLRHTSEKPGLTQPMSNQAAAVVVLPVAMQTAIRLGLNPRSMAMVIALDASTSDITPLEPACLIVYGLGRYRFLDFLKVGSLLTVLVYLVAIILVPLVWPLH